MLPNETFGQVFHVVQSPEITAEIGIVGFFFGYVGGRVVLYAKNIYYMLAYSVRFLQKDEPH